MYCTISEGPASTSLGDDASSAYLRFRHQARTLGTISRSFDALALSTTAAYYLALTQPTSRTWIELISQTAALVQRTHTLDRIVMLGAKEREALGFFEAIVSENADLLDEPARLAEAAELAHSAQTAAAWA